MILKKDYLKSIIREIKLGSFSFNDERDKLRKQFFDGIVPIENLNNQNELTTSIFSDLDELEQQVSENRYITGSYYTNNVLIKRIFDEYECYEKRMLDPAAGTGNFLIHFLLRYKDKFKTKNDFVSYISNYLYFNEIKESSHKVYLMRLEFLCFSFFNEKLTVDDIEKIKMNNTYDDFLFDFNHSLSFDVIIGNPPYLGTKSLGKSYLNKIKKEYGFTDDLYSLFVFRALNCLKRDGFLSFVTSSTYLTLSSKQRLRDKMVSNGLYKIVKNNESHFNIKTKTAVFFINKSLSFSKINIFSESENGSIKSDGLIDGKLGIKFVCFDNEYGERFYNASLIYEKYKKKVSTTKTFEKFITSDEFKNLVKENEYLPLGLIAYIATGVDFKGNNSTALYSDIENGKYNAVGDLRDIEFKPSKGDFINGLNEKRYIPAIKGNDNLFVLWSKEYVNYLKEIKAPLRNIRLYGKQDKIYCKTSDYSFKIVDKYTLCINTAGACFIIPIIDITLVDLLKQIDSESVKEYLKENINNSLCLTPNDLKIIPIKIR